MPGEFTSDGQIFRAELLRQLCLFPVDILYTCLFRLSEIGETSTFAHCIFIYRDNEKNGLKMLKRKWESHDLSFVFAPGIYRTDLLRFKDAHRPVINSVFFEEMVSTEINAPEKHNSILLDGSSYCLRTVNGERVSEKYWQLPNKQLTGRLKLLVDQIYTESGDFDF